MIQQLDQGELRAPGLGRAIATRIWPSRAALNVPPDSEPDRIRRGRPCGGGRPWPACMTMRLRQGGTFRPP